MIHYYTNNISISFEVEEEWMIYEVEKISQKLIEQGIFSKNKKSLYMLFEEHISKMNHNFYGSLLQKIITYISRSSYKIISIDPFKLEKI